jgi:glycosyltransferase involved in cell wall biosynthesis
MKILLVTGIFPPEIGGPATFAQAAAARLIAAGHEVSVVTLAVSAPAADAWPFRVLTIPRAASRWRRWILVYQTVRREALRADVIVCAGLFSQAVAANRRVRRPLVIRFVGDPVWERLRNLALTTLGFEEFQRDPGGILPRTLVGFRNRVLRRASRVVVPSRYLAEHVAAMGVLRERIRVIPNGVHVRPISADRWRSEASRRGDAAVHAVVVGRLVPWKGLDGVFGAVAAVGAVRLDVIGDGPDADRLKGVVARQRLTDRIRFLGRMDSAGVHQVLDRADILILNSEYEGLPHVVLEAMERGAAVIARAIDGLPEIIDHGRNGLLVRGTSELTAALTRLTNDPEYRFSLAKAGRQSIEASFRIEDQISRWERELASMAGAAAGSAALCNGAVIDFRPGRQE